MGAGTARGSDVSTMGIGWRVPSMRPTQPGSASKGCCRRRVYLSQNRRVKMSHPTVWVIAVPAVQPRHYLEQGLSITAIAETLQVDRRGGVVSS